MVDKRTGGLILAAGRSSRMGAFKPLLPLGESNMLLTAVGKLRFCCGSIAVVIGKNSAQMEEAIAPYPYVAAINNKDFKTAPMFSSVALGIEYFMGKCDRLFILPCDIPAFSERTLSAMLKLMDAAKATIIKPTYGGRSGHPVLISSAVFRSILDYGGERGLAGAIEAFGGAAVVAVSDRGILLDADTQQDYERLVEYYKSSEAPDIDEI